jgi:choline-glycine betaine transporter
METYDYFSLGLDLFITIILVYMITITDSSDEVFDKLTGQVVRKGKSRARRQRFWHAIVLICISFIFIGRIKTVIYREMQQDVQKLKERVFPSNITRQ